MSSISCINSIIKSHIPPPIPSPPVQCWYHRKFNNNINYINKFQAITRQLQLSITIIMPYSILVCIAEFATGFKQSCTASMLISWDKLLFNTSASTPLLSQCTGSIYGLESDNFIEYNTSTHNSRGLMVYQCNNPHCCMLTHLLKCSVENCNNVRIMEEKRFMFNVEGLCCNSQNRLDRPPTSYKCTKSFCKHHVSTNGLKCMACKEYYCMECVHDSMGYCIITVPNGESIWSNKMKKSFDEWICKHCIWGKSEGEIPKCIILQQ